MSYTITDGIEEAQERAKSLAAVRAKYPLAYEGRHPTTDAARVWINATIEPNGLALIVDHNGYPTFCPFETIAGVRVWGPPTAWEQAGERFRMLKTQHPEAWAFLLGAKAKAVGK